MKTLVRSVARQSNKAIARQAMGHQRVREHVFHLLKREIQKDMSRLCARKSSSMLRDTSVEALSCFTWDALCEELAVKGPPLLAILKACAEVKRRKQSSIKKKGSQLKTRHCSDVAVIGVMAAVLLRHCNQDMNLVQRMVTLILYNSHCSKQI